MRALPRNSLPPIDPNPDACPPSASLAHEERSGTHTIPAGTRRRILFVDDEPAILDSLRAVLRPQRREWEMVFALGGRAALEEIQCAPFDVVVTDTRMRAIDGAELLRQVKELQPQTVRIVLSGQTDSEAAMKTVFTAHQFLAKPCDAQQLTRVIERACRLNDLVAAPELRALAGDTALLPAAPKTYTAITDALAKPACSMGELAGIVERDPALCAKLLQVVNSAFFGLPRSVSSALQAASYLGTSALRSLALAMEVVAVASSQQLRLSPRQLQDFQANSLLVALLGRHYFAGDRRKADQAFVAGMLRDVGHLLLAAQPHVSPEGARSHGALGAYLLGLWNLPHSVLEPVAYHEQPEELEHLTVEVVDVVHLADRIAGELLPSPFQSVRPPLDEARLLSLGMTQHELEALRHDARQLLSHTRALLKP